MLKKYLIILFVILGFLPIITFSQKIINTKQKKILELILTREQEITDRINDLDILYKEGLISFHEADIYKEELKELKQYEFIVREPTFIKYENILKEKISFRLSNLQKEIIKREILATEGLISNKELEELQSKASLFNYLLEFLGQNNLLFLSQNTNNKFSIINILGKNFPISSSFGFRIDPVNNNRKQFHAGIDFAAYTGTPIRSPLAGQIIKINTNINSGGGLQITIRHNNFDTVYMHLSKIYVQTNQIIKSGEIIGLVGSTGKRVTGAHLHFEIRVNSISVNPAKYMIF